MIGRWYRWRLNRTAAKMAKLKRRVSQADVRKNKIIAVDEPR